MLSAADYDAELAERYGWINLALPADTISDFVKSLAHRIARFLSQDICAPPPTEVPEVITRGSFNGISNRYAQRTSSGSQKPHQFDQGGRRRHVEPRRERRRGREGPRTNARYSPRRRGTLDRCGACCENQRARESSPDRCCGRQVDVGELMC